MRYFRTILYNAISVFEEAKSFIQYRGESNLIMLKLSWSQFISNLLWNPLYKLRRGIKNLFIWFPVIWKNDVWDHFFLTDLIDKQMKQMEDFFYSDLTYTTNGKKYAKRICWTRKLMKMWNDDYYSMLAYRNKTDIKEYGIIKM